MKNKWSDKEKELLLSYVWADDSELIDDRLEHARYKLYFEEQPSEFKERSLLAVKRMYYNIIKNHGKYD